MTPPCTLDKWHAVLTHELTRYDIAQSRREARRGGIVNHYRLSHLFGAAQRAREEAERAGGTEAALAAALQRNFTFDYSRRTGTREPPAMLRRFMAQLASGECKLKP